MDDWYEPSEFEIKIEEFKEELRNSVKKEIQDELDRLKKENALLQDVKENWEEQLASIQAARAEYVKARKDAISEAKRMRLHELFSDSIGPAWTPHSEYRYTREKCDKCDKDGHIRYKSPQGYDRWEECDCRKKVLYYYPAAAKVCQIIKDGRPPKYEPYKVVFDVSDEKEDEFRSTTTIYNDEPFEEVWPYRIVFMDKTKCQEYCDWQNEQQKRKSR